MATPDATAAALREWAEVKGRRPNWRQKTEPYALGVAEILLQKTKAEDVEKVWAQVLSAYPNARSMVDAVEDELRALISGLGLGNQRVQRLKAMADAIQKGEAEQGIPGLGPYGSAIVSLTRGRTPDVAPVDGNIARVVCRHHGLCYQQGEPRKKPEVKETVAQLLATQARPKGKLQLVYALVDLGALVCRPNNPNCTACPVSRSCVYARERSL